MKYDYKAVEAKWQKVWEDEKTFHVEIDHKKPKFYALVEFPYPSGAGLHVGHPRSYTALDVVSRKRRQNGYNAVSHTHLDVYKRQVHRHHPPPRHHGGRQCPVRCDHAGGRRVEIAQAGSGTG